MMVDNLIVDPNMRGMGLGTALIPAIEEIARVDGCSLIMLVRGADCHTVYHL